MEPDGEFFYPTADLYTPVSNMAWPLAMGGVLARSCRAVGLNEAILVGTTGDWIRAGLRKTFRDYVDWHRLRRQLLHWLAFDPLTLALHRRIFPNRHAGLDSFNWVNRHLRHLSLVAVERPRLLPFLSLVHREEGTRLKELTRELEEGGITPAARRWLERVGFEPFDQATQMGRLEGAAKIVAQFANRLERLRIDQPSVIFIATAVSLGPEYPDWFLLAMHREMERLIDEGYEPPDALPIGYEEAVRWIRTARPTPDSNQRRGGWSWIEAQANKAWVREILEDPKPWNCPYDTFVHGLLEVKPIKNLSELYEEGMAMRNCLKSHADDCTAGTMQPFSVREVGTGKRIACFMLQRICPEEPWRVLEVAGPMNAPATPEMREIASMTRERCNAKPFR